jgi:hypothetical protein
VPLVCFAGESTATISTRGERLKELPDDEEEDDDVANAEDDDEEDGEAEEGVDGFIAEANALFCC